MATELEIAKRTAEMLAMPHLVCGHRSCRRGPRCRFFDPETERPDCYFQLDDDEFKDFIDLFALALYGEEELKAFLASDPALPPDLLKLVEAAFEIACAAASKGRRG